MGYGLGIPEFPNQIKPNIVRWVMPGWAGEDTRNIPVNNGIISYTPILVTETTDYDRVGVRVRILQAGATLDLRLFAWVNGVPGRLIEDFGNVSLAAIAFVEIVIALTLAKGFYFLARRSAAGAGSSLAGFEPGSSSWAPVSASNVQQGPPVRPNMLRTSVWTDPAPPPTSTAAVSEAAIYLREV